MLRHIHGADGLVLSHGTKCGLPNACASACATLPEHEFLIDECLHTSLVAVANDAGYEAHHVVRLGLQSMPDEILMRRVRAQEFTFVTNNRWDFERLFSKEPLHAGLIILLKSSRPSLQKELFRAVLLHIAADEPINSAVLVDKQDASIIIQRYPLFRPN